MPEPSPTKTLPRHVERLVIALGVGVFDAVLLFSLWLRHVPSIWFSQLSAFVDSIGLTLGVIVSGGANSPYYVILPAFSGQRIAER